MRIKDNIARIVAILMVTLFMSVFIMPARNAYASGEGIDRIDNCTIPSAACLPSFSSILADGTILPFSALTIVVISMVIYYMVWGGGRKEMKRNKKGL
ncbi:hypothetical protein SAMN05216413_2183 [Ruminococcaceae bacterium KH2T8]|nr:hypothetical protein SAMN05216413_2183 [Ruminococcaceae bacterium KH2T8]